MIDLGMQLYSPQSLLRIDQVVPGLTVSMRDESNLLFEVQNESDSPLHVEIGALMAIIDIHTV